MVKMSEGHLWCVHTISFSELTKESSILGPNDHAKFVGVFHLQRECRMKIEHVLFPSVFSKLRIRLMEGHF